MQLVFEERGKPEYPEKNLSEQGREPIANSIHIWCRRRDLNPGHIGGRRVFSPLRHPCSHYNRMFVAIRFSRRRFRHLTAKAHVNTPSVCDTIIANNTEQNSLVRFWMAVARLRYLSTNCTLTFGCSHCCTLSIFPEWNQWDFSWGPREKRRTRQFESKVKAIHGTSPCCDVCVYFRMLLFFVKYAHWPLLTYFSPHRPRTGHRDWLQNTTLLIVLREN